MVPIGQASTVLCHYRFVLHVRLWHIGGKLHGCRHLSPNFSLFPPRPTVSSARGLTRGAGSLQDCSVQFVRKKSTRHVEWEEKTEGPLLILSLPLVWMQHGKSLREVSWNPFVLMCFISQVTPPPSCVTFLPVLGPVEVPRGPYCTSWTRDRKHGPVSVILLRSFVPSLKISPSKWQQNHSMCHNDPLSSILKKRGRTFLRETESSSPSSSITSRLKDEWYPALWVIGLWLCFLRQQRPVGACNRAASSGQWRPPPGLWWSDRMEDIRFTDVDI